MIFKNVAFSIVSYIRHQIKCRGARWLHPPYLFHLYTSLQNRNTFQAILQRHQRRIKDLKKNNTPVQYVDVGAGAHGSKTQKSVAVLAKNALMPSHELHKILILTHLVQPDYFVELGTCLGETSLCLHKAFPLLPLVTLEGAAPLAAFARAQFLKENAKAIDLREGLFVDTLPMVLEAYAAKGRGMYLIDGHHAFEPTLDYADLIFQRSAEGSVLIFDDIHWSPGMFRAWKRIQQHPKSITTITWFRSGWVFTDPYLTPGHYNWRG